MGKRRRSNVQEEPDVSKKDKLIDENLNYVISDVKDSGLTDDQALDIMRSYEDIGGNYVYKRYYPLRYQKCVNVDCGVGTSHRFISIGNLDDAKKPKVICCFECSTYHKENKLFPVKKRPKFCMNSDCTSFQPNHFVPVYNSGGVEIGNICAKCNNKPTSSKQIDYTDWKCENRDCNQVYVKDEFKIYPADAMNFLDVDYPIARLCHRCKTYANNNTVDRDGVTYNKLRAKEIIECSTQVHECLVRLSSVCLKQFKTNTLYNGELFICSRCRSLIKLDFF